MHGSNYRLLKQSAFHRWCVVCVRVGGGVVRGDRASVYGGGGGPRARVCVCGGKGVTLTSLLHI